MTLIRASSIRGQLRFWWRATRGARFTGAAALAEREGAIFGTPETPSRVTVQVSDVDAAPPKPCAVWRQRPEWNDPLSRHTQSLAYCLFPFQGESPNRAKAKPPAPMVVAARFTLTISAPDDAELRRELDAALWAWVNFGGLGARTRRGCGALYCADFAPAASEDLGRWFAARLAEHAPDLPSERRPWPTLSGDFLPLPNPGDPVEAWARAVGLLREFRQGAVGRKPGNPRPGRSRWPEPETIRRLTVGWRGRHQRLEQVPADAFPRAELGLPIVFEFKGDAGGDPPKTELYPQVGGRRATRMGSPLVVKPLAVSAERAVPLVLRLNAPPPRGAILLKGREEEVKGSASCTIRDPALAAYPNSPLGPAESPHSAAGSAVEAFLALAREQGYGGGPAR